MEAKFVILVGFHVALLLVAFSHAISVVAENVNSDLDSKVSPEKKETKLSGEEVDRNKVGSNPVKVDQEENGGDQTSVSQKGVQNSEDSSDSSGTSDSVKDHNSHKKVDGLGEKVKDNTGGKGEEKPDNISKQKERSKDVKNEADSSTRKDGSGGEACDASNMCTFEGDELVACLRVPGNDSPDLSLLIQNKGKNPATITISGPEFVHVERTQVQLQPRGNDKVKVSISDGGGNGDTIVLNSGKVRCNLDFRNLIPQNAEKGNHDNSPETTYFGYLRRSPVVAIVAFASILTAAAACTCIIIRKKRFSNRSSKYQRLDMELPISIGDKSVLQRNDGWDNSWDDDWGNEDAPMTPSTAVTPSFSSPGLASRRLNKEGWKD